MSLLSPNLQAFLAIAETGTVHSAASKINLTQTGVTQRIRALERDLNCTLFIRSRKGMQLTHEGSALLNYCQQSIETEAITFSKIHRAGLETFVDITISGPTSIMGSRVSRQVNSLYKKFPKFSNISKIW